MMEMIKKNDLKGLERTLSQQQHDSEELHKLLVQAYNKEREGIVEMLIQHPCYTPRVLAKIVVDAFEFMQAEFAFYLLNRASFCAQALNASLHETAARKDEGDLERIIGALVKMGADTSSRDESGRTAQDIVRASGQANLTIVNFTLINLLRPKPAPAEKPASPMFRQAATAIGLPSDVLAHCFSYIPLADRKTIGSASSVCQRFYVELQDNRKAARTMHEAGKLGSRTTGRRAGHFHELVKSLHEEGMASAHRPEYKASILSCLIRQIRHLKKEAATERAFMAALDACIVLPGPDRNGVLMDLACMLKHLPSNARENASEVLSEKAGRLARADDVNGLRLILRGSQLCRLLDAMDLGGRLEALARDCNALPPANRTMVVHRLIPIIAAIRDNALAQCKALSPLQSMIDSLPVEGKMKALLSLYSRLHLVPGSLLWVGMFTWSMKQASQLNQADKSKVGLALCKHLHHLESDMRLYSFKELAGTSREFLPEYRVRLLRDLARGISILPNNGAREEWFRTLVGDSTDLSPGDRAGILFSLCCRLEEFDSKPRTEMYMLLVQQLYSLPSREKASLMAGRGLGDKLRYLSGNDARHAAYRALAEFALELAHEDRKPVVNHMTSDAVLRHVPDMAEKDAVCAKLRASVEEES
jgi:hypothetical protein